jgi:hypothetical protein
MAQGEAAERDPPSEPVPAQGEFAVPKAFVPGAVGTFAEFRPPGSSPALFKPIDIGRDTALAPLPAPPPPGQRL